MPVDFVKIVDSMPTNATGVTRNAAQASQSNARIIIQGGTSRIRACMNSATMSWRSQRVCGEVVTGEEFAADLDQGAGDEAVELVEESAALGVGEIFGGARRRGGGGFCVCSEVSTQSALTSFRRMSLARKLSRSPFLHSKEIWKSISQGRPSVP